jgi:hypothetical protein
MFICKNFRKLVNSFPSSVACTGLKLLAGQKIISRRGGGKGGGRGGGGGGGGGGGRGEEGGRFERLNQPWAIRAEMHELTHG